MSLTIEVTLVISASCPHCPAMMDMLSQLTKKGDIGVLKIVNIAADSELTSQYNIRSVPWMRIGPFIRTGLHTQEEIKYWLSQIVKPEGIKNYLVESLDNGELESVTLAAKYSPELLTELLPLISDDETSINVRLGLGAILEELAGERILENLLPDLESLLHHANPRVRGDAAHFLSFVHSKNAVRLLQSVANETEEDVKEIIQESLEELESLVNRTS